MKDVVVFGGGQVGTAIARLLAAQDIGVRLIEPDRDRARAVAEELPECRVYNATGVDVDFLERELIGRAQAAVFAIKNDAENHYAAFTKLAHENKLLVHAEAGGPHGAPIDALQSLGHSDVPMMEFWAKSPMHRVKDIDRFFVKQAASAAHI